MNNIYKISLEYQQLADALIESGGEVTLELETALAINKEELELKAQSYGFVIRKLESENATIDSEIDRLKSLKESRVKALDRLSNNIVNAFLLFDIEKVETPLMKIRLSKSEAIEIDNEDEIQAEFIKEKTVTTKSVDKMALKTAIKSGRAISGAHIKTNFKINLK